MKPRKKHVRPHGKSRDKRELGYWNTVPARVKREIVNMLEFWKEKL